MLRVFGLGSLALTLAAMLAVSPAARAEDAAATSTSGGIWDAIQKNGKASYLLWLQGMRSESLSGNRDGSGTSLQADHYVALGASLGNGFTFRMTNLFSQPIDEDATNKPVNWADPYFTLSKSKLLNSEKYAFNMDAYLRYYAPLSRSTQDGVNKGARDDKGRGQLRIYVAPSKSFFDGALTLAFTSLAQFKFNANTPQERFDKASREFAKTGAGNLGTSIVSYREDMYFVFNPSLAYQASSKVEAYVEWASLWRHTTNGKWSSVNHPSDGQYISPGINWTPTKKILVNPYVSYQLSAINKKDNPTAGVEKGIDHFDVGVQLQYTFL
jgi:hypothetical protein